MKTLKISLCLMVILSVFACSSDDDSIENSPANVIFTTDGVEYRFGNGVFVVGSGSDALDARQDQTNRTSIVVSESAVNDNAINQIFITINGTTYFGDEGNVAINNNTSLEGNFQGVYNTAHGSNSIAVTNRTFFVDK
jgi:sugar lactone lactonase YvrE